METKHPLEPPRKPASKLILDKVWERWRERFRAESRSVLVWAFFRPVLKSTLSILSWNPPCLFCAEIYHVYIASLSILVQEFAQLPEMVECHEVTRDMLFHFILIILHFLSYTQGSFKKKGTQNSKVLEHLLGKAQFKEKMNSYETMNLHTHTHTQALISSMYSSQLLVKFASYQTRSFWKVRLCLTVAFFLPCCCCCC